LIDIAETEKKKAEEARCRNILTVAVGMNVTSQLIYVALLAACDYLIEPSTRATEAFRAVR
jgi:hypothetical protein